MPKRFTSHAEHKIPLIDPIDRPNSTMPISAVDTDKISRIAGVRVAQDAISNPGIKKNINSAHRRRCRALRGEINVIEKHQKYNNSDNTNKFVYICT
ncbi:hypothetical protein D3C85_1567470 [compost metagenome]